MTHIVIEEDFFEKNKEKARKASIEFGGKEYEKSLQFDWLTSEIEELSFEDDKIELQFSNPLGYFSINIPLDAEDLERLLGVVIKRMNKIKTMLETLK